MTEFDLKKLACDLSAISVFRGVAKADVLSALRDFLVCEGSASDKMYLYGEFVSRLADTDYCFSDYLVRAVCEDENRYIVGVADGVRPSAATERNVRAELAVFSRLTALTPAELCGGIDGAGYLPIFENTPTDFERLYFDRVAKVGRFGYGIFARAGMFRVSGEEIIPVRASDDISVESFVGYAEERELLIENTRALVEGRSAANALLCGDAGTGKSSTVKACANLFFDRGVRLIELRKDQLFALPYVMERISRNPLKFIIFIDDLSFNKNDDCFSMLKAALEGSASAKTKNAVIYATSNRRHIVKESFSDRADADDVHHSDTVSELMSLSDRFGLTIYFSRPNKALYLEIVRELADRAGLKIDRATLELKAEEFALRRGSRSPRAAEHFIESLL